MRSPYRFAFAGVAAALVNSSNQVGGSLGAALLNTIAASAAASYLTGNAPHASLQAATVHGDVIAFTFLAVLFTVGAVATALLFPGVSPCPRQPRTTSSSKSAPSKA